MKPPGIFPQSGSQVTLRNLQVDDLRAFQVYRHDPEVGRLQGWVPEPDESALEFLNAMSRVTSFAVGEWVQLGIVEKVSDRLIGDIGVFVSGDQSEAEVGISLQRESQGKGLAAGALSLAISLIFNHTPVESVKAITDERNQTAIKLLERVGMNACSIQDRLFRGLPCREMTFVLSREDHGE